MQTHHTVTSIASRTGEKPAAINYLLRSRRIKPAGRIGLIRLFDDAGLNAIERELSQLRRNRRLPVTM
jgi:hypothetical protein